MHLALYVIITICQAGTNTCSHTFGFADDVIGVPHAMVLKACRDVAHEQTQAHIKSLPSGKVYIATVSCKYNFEQDM